MCPVQYSSYVCVQVNEEALTRALAAHFSWLCSCVVLPADLTADSFTQLGGIIYYRASILSPHSERLVSNLSSYTKPGNKRLRLSGNYFIFLGSCPTEVNEDFCTISVEDSAALRCSVDYDETAEPSTKRSVIDDRSPWLVVSVTLGTTLLVLVTLLFLFLYRCYRKSRKSDKSTIYRSSSSKPILPDLNCNLENNEDRVASSEASTTSR